MRKVIELTAQWCERLDVSDWRQHKYNVRHFKRLMRTAQNRKRSKASSEEQQQKNAALIVAAHQEYLDIAQHYLSKAQATLAMFAAQSLSSPFDASAKIEIEGYMQHALRQIEQTRRRVIAGDSR